MDFLLQPLPWHGDALCADAEDPDLWFPEQGQNGKEARAICARCPVQGQCLEYAIDTDQEFGIWGNTSRRERRKLARDRLKRSA